MQKYSTLGSQKNVFFLQHGRDRRGDSSVYSSNKQMDNADPLASPKPNHLRTNFPVTRFILNILSLVRWHALRAAEPRKRQICPGCLP
jgi:hypothetical protein